ncbi:MAG: ribosome small subunit-dependent GTPase A [Pseudomonadota bacterium]
MPVDPAALQPLGWKTTFAQQLTLDEFEGFSVARVMAVQRAGLTLSPGPDTPQPLAGRWFQLPAEERPTVGDWLLIDDSSGQIERILERSSLLKRIVPGRTSEVQLIGANVDVLFIVSSCNADFNANRIERYLALAHESGAAPVVVLTKADLSAQVDDYADAVRALDPALPLAIVNALDPDTLDEVRAWCRPGDTVALLGSSGVGKSTLLNALAGHDLQLTGSIREDDAKGRHTTTHRSLHLLASGALVLDSPGIRELQITELDSGLARTFEDIETLAEQCRFNDCQHEREPGCAVQDALESGDLEQRRLDSYNKLKREERYARETVAERRARTKAFGKMTREIINEPPKRTS